MGAGGGSGGGSVSVYDSLITVADYWLVGSALEVEIKVK